MAPLTQLTSPEKPFRWLPEAETAFCLLKAQFSETPILVQPDPSRQFVGKANASDMGVRTFLSQRAEDGKLRPCMFFPRRLSSVERKYVGNQELLVMKLAFEECRHWLEGTEHTFLIWTDHKNLKYIKTAKRLNS